MGLGAQLSAICSKTDRNVADSAALDSKMITSYVVRGSTGKKDSKSTGEYKEKPVHGLLLVR